MIKENSITEKLEAVLQNLLEINRDIKFAIITSVEGFPILSILPRRYNKQKIAAMVASLLSISKRTVVDMEIGVFKQIYIKGIEGYILILDAEEAVLAVLTKKKAKMGLVFFDCKDVLYKIGKILRKEN
ncbi:MAG: roadblock/LC7 domain-containing protein [Candidatus Hermodarchaeota archaeon]